MAGGLAVRTKSKKKWRGVGSEDEVEKKNGGGGVEAELHIRGDSGTLGAGCVQRRPAEHTRYHKSPRAFGLAASSLGDALSQIQII